MRIAEPKLRQIIREEAELRLIRQVIIEVVNEMHLELTEDQRLILEASVLDALKSAAKKAAIPITIMAALAFGSETAQRVDDLAGVGITPGAAQQISNAFDASTNITDQRMDALQKSIEASSERGDLPADLQKGISPDKAKNIAMDRLESEYVLQGNVKSTGQAQAGPGGAQYLMYVPYDNLPDDYKDTFTGGASKEDLKKFYQTMDVKSLRTKVKVLNSWGSEGHGNFYNSSAGQLLPASWSIAYKALQDKIAQRGSLGKNIKENA